LGELAGRTAGNDSNKAGEKLLGVGDFGMGGRLREAAESGNDGRGSQVRQEDLLFEDI